MLIFSIMMNIDAISMQLSNLNFKGSQVEIFSIMLFFCHEDLFLTLQTVHTLMICRIMINSTYMAV